MTRDQISQMVQKAVEDSAQEAGIPTQRRMVEDVHVLDVDLGAVFTHKDPNAEATLTDFLQALVPLIEEIVGQEIAKARGNVDHWAA